MTISRRRFIGTTAGAVAAFGLGGRMAYANPLGLPLGIQLYSVRREMAGDFEGTLAGVAEAGYTEVESAALPKKSAKEIRAALDTAGLKCVSSHRGFADFKDRFDETVAFDKECGVSNMICPGPGKRDASVKGPMTLDDWHYNAEQFNLFGEKLAKMGITFGYHNHTGEFAETEGKIPYFELLRLTDPKKVTFELDCGWAFVAGRNPVDLMKTYPYRFSMIHVKDFKLPPNPSPEAREQAKVTELGQGSTDYKPVFAQAAKTQHIRHAFVEQEAFDMPWKQSLSVDAAYLKAL
jgi:sugar phosphate isomerase/epimerase